MYIGAELLSTCYMYRLYRRLTNDTDNDKMQDSIGRCVVLFNNLAQVM